MNFEFARPTPARLSGEASARLPRLALLALLLAFALPGVFGRDLWPEDASAFGRMWSMAHGAAADWWFPHIAGLTTPRDGPFPFWLGAAAIRVFGGWIGDVAASRLSVLFWFVAAAASLWAATRRLAMHEAAQPLAPAFGRQVPAADYAAMLADIAVLLFVSTLGILLALHVTSVDTVSVALVAAALYGLSSATERPLAGAALAGACCGALILGRNPLLALGLLGGCVAALVLSLRAARARLWPALAACLALALAVAAIWPAVALTQFPHQGRAFLAAWLHSISRNGLLTREDGVWLPRNASWYVWPLWPLAAWSLYAWRRHLAAPHMAPPAAVLAGLTLALALSAPLDESKLVFVIAPLTILAAFAFPTLQRALQQWFDWFAIAVYSLFAAYVWAYFLALVSGKPRAMAHSVARLISGHAPGTSFIPLFIALGVSSLWVALIVWRIRRRPPVLWRGAVLSAAGITALWLIAAALFLPAADYNRSYRAFAEQLGRRVPAGECVAAVGISNSMRAVIAYYGHIHFALEGAADGCSMALRPRYRKTAPAPLPADPGGSWNLVWEGRRPVRSDETWQLWHR